MRTAPGQAVQIRKGEMLMVMTVLLLLLIALAVILILVIWLVASYNKFIKLRNKTEEAYSAMDVSLKKRYDLIPGYVETVKAYARHERETLEAVLKARSSAARAGDPAQRIASENALSGALKDLFAVAEAYPDLKADANFRELQQQLSRLEEEIAGSRRYYNGVVNKYNTQTEMFPGSLLAKLFGFERKPLYEVTNAEEREKQTLSF